MATTEQIALKGPNEGRFTEVLTPEALAFVGRLQREFGERRLDLLRKREERQARPASGALSRVPAEAQTGRGCGSEGCAGASGSRGPSGRDHRSNGSQDADQRPELGRAGFHGGFRGRQLADVDEPR